MINVSILTAVSAQKTQNMEGCLAISPPCVMFLLKETWITTFPRVSFEPAVHIYFSTLSDEACVTAIGSLMGAVLFFNYLKRKEIGQLSDLVALYILKWEKSPLASIEKKMMQIKNVSSIILKFNNAVNFSRWIV